VARDDLTATPVSRSDGGGSSIELAWVLCGLTVQHLARAEGYDPGPLVALRDVLADRLVD
jgi:hypothetical protein